MAKGDRKFVWAGGTFLLFVLPIAFFILPSILRSNYSTSLLPEGEFLGVAEETDAFVVTHIATPEPVKALYMTSCVAGTPSWRASLKELIDTTELNAVVIDIKDYTGTVSFPLLRPNSAKATMGKQGFEGQANTGKGCVVSDMREFIAELHRDDIYVIGRVSVFQDISYTTLFPELAVKSMSTGSIWKDHKGLSFIDVGAKPYWDYILDISREAYALGFDELNYDYVRYPSDGNMADVNFTWSNASSTKSEMLESFFSYLSDNMKDVGAVTSVDIFGMTTTVTSDMGIGQVLEKTLPYFDYVAPMVYPSHYPPTWNGFANPAEYPYEVIKISISRGLERERAYNIANGFFTVDETGATTTSPSKLRPWLQDFNLGATYTPEKVRAQIQATYDVGLTSWMLWSAGNKYTVEALLPK